MKPSMKLSMKQVGTSVDVDVVDALDKMIHHRETEVLDATNLNKLEQLRKM
jgi:hypothetical protein